MVLAVGPSTKYFISLVMPVTAGTDMCRHVHAQGMTQAELMVEAKQELLRVAEMFDASKGARLTTYAWYYIMSRITRVGHTSGPGSFLNHF